MWNIWKDVKLLTCMWFARWLAFNSWLDFILEFMQCFPLNFSRGAVNLIPSTAQRRRWFEIVISGLIIPTYLLFLIFRQWQPAKPRTGMSFFNIFWNNFPTKLSVLQSMSGHVLHRCRNLFGKKHFGFSRLWSSNITWQVYWSVFARTMHSVSFR